MKSIKIIICLVLVILCTAALVACDADKEEIKDKLSGVVSATATEALSETAAQTTVAVSSEFEIMTVAPSEYSTQQESEVEVETTEPAIENTTDAVVTEPVTEATKTEETTEETVIELPFVPAD